MPKQKEFLHLNILRAAILIFIIQIPMDVFPVAGTKTTPLLTFPGMV
jgi:hypothetical protein